MLRQIIDEVMFEIRDLTGQEYVDEYATKKAESFPSAESTNVVAIGGERPSTNGDGPDDTSEQPRRSSADVLSKWA